MEEIREDIEQIKVQILTGIKLGRVEKEWGNMIIETCNRALTIPVVVSSAWYCKISTAKGQWFEIVTGKNEMEVAVKITEKFGKETVYNLIDKYELM